ncbi:lytic transglycosylase F [candidate division LCP-89 bacterium B3_LCP]|uniref:Lytic transglycosylase F n=1 Tax=candidate division LCP-89 bacterium B3_LCP TaxID=2012998 RepID=A0A532V504_UNCL8|nr:MAG: lytic transglycosylase F [candidate division LCP-89 bacterium B3_LCP]
MKKPSIILLSTLLLFACQSPREKEPELKPVAVDLLEIRERGNLVAVTGYGANSYFLYKGQPMGYEYELLNILADHLDLNVELKIVKDMDLVFDALNQGEVDIIALGLTVTKDRAEKVAFTEHHNETRQVLVQRKPDNWRLMKLHEIERLLIRNPIDLLGAEVHVRKGSSYYARLVNLSEEIGGDIKIKTVPGHVSTDELIGQVSRGEIDYTIADEHIAKINSAFYADIDYETPISFPQRIAWAVRKSSPELLETVNQWTREMKQSAVYYTIYNKYYKDRGGYRKRVRSEFYAFKGGRISKYDDLIKQHATELDWDWRLLASLIYRESHFDPWTRSWAGAVGLMQLIPETARQYGALDIYDPAQNLKAGTKYLKWLEGIWQGITDPIERTKFILASYNAGQGHVFDARRLARKYDRDPDIWDDNVGYFILKKSSAEYFNDEVVEHGYCRGGETYAYVRDVFELYEHYKKHVQLEEAIEPPVNKDNIASEGI